MASGVSIREFARREKCSDTLVRKALKLGRLTALSDGSIDPALVGTGWRLGNRKAANPANSATRDGETPEEAAERIVSTGHAPYEIAEAERIKENYLALLRQLEFDTKSGLVVPVAVVAEAVAKKFATVRTRLLAIPAEQAPRLQRLKTVAEVQDALQEIITEALEELTRDGAGRKG